MRHIIRICALFALTFIASPSLSAQHSCSYTVDRLDGDVYYGMERTAIMFTDLARCWNMWTRHRSGFPRSSPQMRLMATCVPGMVEIAVTMDTDSTTTAVIIKPILMCFLEAGRYPMPMCPVLRFLETGMPRTHFMYTGVEKYSTTPVRRLSRSPVTAMPRMLSTHISMAAKYVDSIYG